MSIVVLCVEILGIHLNTLNLLGNKVTIHNQHIIHAALWTVLGYYLWRYYQYFHDFGDKGFYTAYSTKRDSIISPIIQKKFINSDYVKSKIRELGGKATIKPMGSYFYVNKLSEVTLNIEYAIVEPNVNRPTENYEYHYSGPFLITSTLISLLHVLVRTRYFSEFILPYFLFITSWYFHSPNHVSWLLSFFPSQ